MTTCCLFEQLGSEASSSAVMLGKEAPWPQQTRWEGILSWCHRQHQPEEWRRKIQEKAAQMHEKNHKHGPASATGASTHPCLFRATSAVLNATKRFFTRHYWRLLPITRVRKNPDYPSTVFSKFHQMISSWKQNNYFSDLKYFQIGQEVLSYSQMTLEWKDLSPKIA